MIIFPLLKASAFVGFQLDAGEIGTRVLQLVSLAFINSVQIINTLRLDEFGLRLIISAFIFNG